MLRVVVLVGWSCFFHHALISIQHVTFVNSDLFILLNIWQGFIVMYWLTGFTLQLGRSVSSLVPVTFLFSGLLYPFSSFSHCNSTKKPIFTFVYSWTDLIYSPVWKAGALTCCPCRGGNISCIFLQTPLPLSSILLFSSNLFYLCCQNPHKALRWPIIKTFSFSISRPECLVEFIAVFHSYVLQGSLAFCYIIHIRSAFIDTSVLYQRWGPVWYKKRLAHFL